jgi:hypothetical protein
MPSFKVSITCQSPEEEQQFGLALEALLIEMAERFIKGDINNASRNSTERPAVHHRSSGQH